MRAIPNFFFVNRKSVTMIVITRKIQVNFDIDEKSQLPELYKKIFAWQRIVHRAANWVVTHQYLQENIKELFYLTDETKVKLGNVQKDTDGILTTSRDNTTYQVLSKAFKGEAPMGMLSGLNTVVTKTYKKEGGDVRYGKRSLRTYRGNIPMPIRSADISNMTKIEDGNYTFSVYGVSFKTYFGKDLSGNESIMDRAVAGEYKLCDSSLQLEKHGNKWKMFYLAVFSFEKQELAFTKDATAVCELSINYPIIIREKKDKFFSIGAKEEYLYQRQAIKGALSRLQAACKYNKGGKGRSKKLVAIERFKEKEKDYIQGKMHLYSRLLVDYCIKRKIGKIVLSNYKEAEEDSHEQTEEGKFLLANWSYFNLADKITYKAGKVGIEVVKE